MDVADGAVAGGGLIAPLMRPRLYKYKPIDEFTLRFLKCREVWFPLVAELNDLHEFAAPVGFSAGTDEQLSELAQMVASHIADKHHVHSPLSRAQLRGDVEATVLRERRDFAWAASASATHFVRNSSTVFCMSERPDAPTMWAYYADSHKGVCIEIGARSLLGDARPVRYCNALRTFDYFGGARDALRDHIALTKMADWAHEREWRLVRPATHSFAEVVDEPLVASLVFGYRTTEADIQRVIDAMEASGSSVPYFHARPSGNSSALDLYPL